YLFVKQLLPVLFSSSPSKQSKQQYNIPSHTIHDWLLYVIEFYTEYSTFCSINREENNDETYLNVKLQGSDTMTFYCDEPFEQINDLLHSAILQADWSQYSPQTTTKKSDNSSSIFNYHSQLIRLSTMCEKDVRSPLACPLSCYLLCTSFPLYVYSTLELSKSVEQKQDYYMFLRAVKLSNQNKNNHYARKQIKSSSLATNYLNKFVNCFLLYSTCLDLIQSKSSFQQQYLNLINKIQLYKCKNYQILFKLYQYFSIEKKFSQIVDESESITAIGEHNIPIQDTPSSPTSTESVSTAPPSLSLSSSSPLKVVDLDELIQKYEDDIIKLRNLPSQYIHSTLQLCSLYLILRHQKRKTITLAIDTLIYVQQYFHSKSHVTIQKQIVYPLLSGTSLNEENNPTDNHYYFINQTYETCFVYLLQIICTCFFSYKDNDYLSNEHTYLGHCLVLLQYYSIKKEAIHEKDDDYEYRSMINDLMLKIQHHQTLEYPKLFSYIYDRSLLGELLNFVQKYPLIMNRQQGQVASQRVWSLFDNSNTNNIKTMGVKKRKLDDDDVEELVTYNDEQFIDHLIQHVSNMTNLNLDQKLNLLYKFIISERKTLQEYYRMHKFQFIKSSSCPILTSASINMSQQIQTASTSLKRRYDDDENDENDSSPIQRPSSSAIKRPRLISTSSESSKNLNVEENDAVNRWLNNSIEELTLRIPYDCMGSFYLGLTEIEVVENDLKTLSVLLITPLQELDYIRVFQRLQAINAFLCLCDNFHGIKERCKQLIQLVGKAWFTILKLLLPSSLFPLNNNEVTKPLILTCDDVKKLWFIRQNIPHFSSILKACAFQGEFITQNGTRYSQYPVVLTYIRTIWLLLKKDLFKRQLRPLLNTTNLMSVERVDNFQIADKRIQMYVYFLSQFFQFSTLEAEVQQEQIKDYNFISEFEKYRNLNDIDSEKYIVSDMQQWKYEQIYKKYSNHCHCTQTSPCAVNIKEKTDGINLLFSEIDN
ncbi:unnamed protein product, partial [Didymodactylos carnosus]